MNLPEIGDRIEVDMQVYADYLCRDHIKYKFVELDPTDRFISGAVIDICDWTITGPLCRVELYGITQEQFEERYDYVPVFNEDTMDLYVDGYIRFWTPILSEDPTLSYFRNLMNTLKNGYAP